MNQCPVCKVVDCDDDCGELLLIAREHRRNQMADCEDDPDPEPEPDLGDSDWVWADWVWEPEPEPDLDDSDWER